MTILRWLLLLLTVAFSPSFSLSGKLSSSWVIVDATKVMTVDVCPLLLVLVALSQQPLPLQWAAPSPSAVPYLVNF